MSENVGASTSRNPRGLHGLYRDFTLPLPYEGLRDSRPFVHQSMATCMMPKRRQKKRKKYEEIEKKDVEEEKMTTMIITCTGKLFKTHLTQCLT
jgi:hypothetical protein